MSRLEPQPVAPPVSPAITVIRPSRGLSHLDLKNLWAYRELIYFLVWRDLKVRYKQTIMGASWAVIQPFSLMIVFTIFFGRLAQIPSDGIPRPIFYFAALVPWTYFSRAVIAATNSVVGNRSIITKIYFPRLVFPIASVISGLVDLVVGLAILIVMTFAYGLPVTPKVLLVPPLILVAVLTALVAGLWFSALNARYRDVGYGVGFLVQLWMFASPIVYPSSLVPEAWRAIYRLNPMASVVEGSRWALTGATSPPGPEALASVGILLVLLVGGVYYFRQNEGRIVDVV